MLEVLHRAAPRLSRHLFPSTKCPVNKVLPVVQTARCQRHSTMLLHRNLSFSTRHRTAVSPASSDLPFTQTGRMQRYLGNTSFKSFPNVSDKAVAYWLLGSAASVFGIVVFGGLTRLTESGLSITEWRPVTGSLPPLNATAWESEFTKYKSSPEFQLLNPNMTMQEFKKIYYMEWTHRLWGRMVGITFILPAVYFIATKRVSPIMAGKILGIGGLIGFQGMLGWWMVKSGLKDDLFEPGSHPRVSQYRLVAHLGTAFLCYSAMLWNGLQILREQRLLANVQTATTILARLRDPRLRLFKNAVGALLGLVFITAMSGGFVAGLDAGLIYNDFPWMGQRWIPPREELFSSFYATKADGRDMWWRNALENPVLAQLDHRLLATTTFTAIVSLFAYARFARPIRHVLPSASRKAMHGVLGFAILQVTLGISTLLYLVPLPLASAHQAGSLALLSYVIILASRTWLPTPRFMNLLVRKLKNVGSSDLQTQLMSSRMQSKSNLFKAFPQLQVSK